MSVVLCIALYSTSVMIGEHYICVAVTAVFSV